LHIQRSPAWAWGEKLLGAKTDMIMRANLHAIGAKTYSGHRTRFIAKKIRE
jgi:hypothetical protein